MKILSFTQTCMTVFHPCNKNVFFFEEEECLSVFNDMNEDLVSNKNIIKAVRSDFI